MIVLQGPSSGGRWLPDKHGTVYYMVRPDTGEVDETVLILSVKGQAPGTDFALLLEMGGKGGWEVAAEGTLAEMKVAAKDGIAALKEQA